MEEIGVKQTGSNAVKFIIDTTYDILVGLIAANKLVRGAHYQFTYNTKYNQEVSGILKTGADEKLVVFATSTNTISPVAESLSFPTDIIYYNISDNVCEDTVTARPGFIWRRMDINSNSAPFDFRAILFLRYAVDTSSIQNFNGAAHAYATGDVIKTGNAVYVCRIGYVSTATFTNDLNGGNWKLLFIYDNTIYLATSSPWSFNEAVVIPTLPLTFIQNTIFNIGNGVTCESVVIEDPVVETIGGTSRFACNIVFLSGGTPIYKNINISGNHIGHTFYNSQGNRIQLAINLKGKGSGCMFTQCQKIEFNSSADISDCAYINNQRCNFSNFHISSTISQCDSTTVKSIQSSFIYRINTDTNFENITFSAIQAARQSEFKNLNVVNYVPVSGTLNNRIYLYDLVNKKFTGNNTNLLVRSGLATAKTYNSNFNNVSATKTSPDGNIWYDIIDNSGDTTSVALT